MPGSFLVLLVLCLKNLFNTVIMTTEIKIRCLFYNSLSNVKTRQWGGWVHSSHVNLEEAACWRWWSGAALSQLWRSSHSAILPFQLVRTILYMWGCWRGDFRKERTESARIEEKILSNPDKIHRDQELFNMICLKAHLFTCLLLVWSWELVLDCKSVFSLVFVMNVSNAIHW